MRLSDSPDARITLAEAEARMRQVAEEAKHIDDPDEKMRLLWNAAYRIYDALEDHRVPE